MPITPETKNQLRPLPEMPCIFHSGCNAAARALLVGAARAPTASPPGWNVKSDWPLAEAFGLRGNH